MTPKERAAMQQALSTDEALMSLELILKDGIEHGSWPLNKNCEDGLSAITVLREALNHSADAGNKVSDHIAGAGKVINADRELLELAAKAACYEVYWHHANQCYMIVEGSSERKWKPLSNGHDSLQLAAKLLMNVEINKASVIVCLPPLESGFTPPPIFEYPVSDYDEDFNVNYFRHYEATCLAILRAAAEIGKELP